MRKKIIVAGIFTMFALISIVMTIYSFKPISRISHNENTGKNIAPLNGNLNSNFDYKADEFAEKIISLDGVLEVQVIVKNDTALIALSVSSKIYKQDDFDRIKADAVKIIMDSGVARAYATFNPETNIKIRDLAANKNQLSEEQFNEEFQYIIMYP